MISGGGFEKYHAIEEDLIQVGNDFAAVRHFISDVDLDLNRSHWKIIFQLGGWEKKVGMKYYWNGKFIILMKNDGCSFCPEKLNGQFKLVNYETRLCRTKIIETKDILL